jgi:hypothetical protein
MDLTGKRFNRLRVVELSATKDYAENQSDVCDCGSECEVSGSCLRRGQTQSWVVYVSNGQNCPIRRTAKKGHGFISLGGMLNRCRNKNCRNFPAYGDRNYTVHGGWASLFYSDMGDPPTSDQRLNGRRTTLGTSRIAKGAFVPTALNRRNTLRVRFRGKQLACK